LPGWTGATKILPRGHATMVRRPSGTVTPPVSSGAINRTALAFTQ
jgi:hypothetical protein